MDKLPIWKKILFASLYTVFVVIASYLNGKADGKGACEQKQIEEVKSSKTQLEQHEKTLETIHTESDSAAVERFLKDNRPD